VQAAYVYAALEAGFQPTLVVGTSVGALNGAWVARRPDDKEELLRIWLGLPPILH
jgi:NTE family protein